jgi:acetyltransferase-like isoleucine patch superfamily enzyme
VSRPRFRLAHDWLDRPLPDNVRIGEGSWVHSAYAFAHMRSRRPCAVRIGRKSGVYIGSFFDLGPHGEVVIGDYCTLVGVIIASNTRVVIESYAFLAHEVVIADHFAAAPWRPGAGTVAADAGPAVVVGEDAWIGARATLLKGARIGAGAIVGAAAVVDFEVPPLAIVAGNPATLVGRAPERASGTSGRS